jgi:site-specific DNA recombinase
LRALIEAVVLTPEGGVLTIDLRGELASMLSQCAGAETQKSLRGYFLGGVVN